jgi:hypothetical protein
MYSFAGPESNQRKQGSSSAVSVTVSAVRYSVGSYVRTLRACWQVRYMLRAGICCEQPVLLLVV